MIRTRGHLNVKIAYAKTWVVRKMGGWHLLK